MAGYIMVIFSIFVKKKNKPTSEVAVHLADKLSKENHPIFGHRGKQIINSLVEDKWHEKE